MLWVTLRIHGSWLSYGELLLTWAQKSVAEDAHIISLVCNCDISIPQKLMENLKASKILNGYK